MAALPHEVVDLRSDTVTQPDSEMRRVIADAVVGDHTLGDDPTAAELERYAAELLGKEAALLFPSGIMANQAAILVQTSPGSEVVIDADAHILNFEECAASAWAGVQLRAVASKDGIPDPDLWGASIRIRSPYLPVTRLVCLENTHNSAGGRVIPFEVLTSVSEMARGRGVRVHLDGARLPNAAIASGIGMRRWAEHADTVMISLSKGLGAPFGSILAGDRETMEVAVRVRRRMGGGLRQIGLLAAAGLHALRHNFDRLELDHARARDLAMGLGVLPGVTTTVPDSNIVMIQLGPTIGSARDIVRGLDLEGVRMIEFGPTRLRAVVHRDVDDEGVAVAVAAFERLVTGTGSKS